MLKETLKRNKGITLIALVVTIIVLLILAGISIAMLTGQNGILNRAAEAKEKTGVAQEDESQKLKGYEDTINQYAPESNGGSGGGSSSNLSDYQTNDTKPYLPDATKFEKVAGTDLSTGLVIKDSNDNEYVWVEVPKTIYTDTKYNTTGTTIKENEWEKIRDCLKAYTADYANSSYSDTNSKFTEQYQAMLKSVYTNGGFWIGRYEAGLEEGKDPRTSYKEISASDKAVIKPNMYPYNYVTRDEAQTLAQKMDYGDCKGSLIFGIQWDLVLKYIETKNPAQKANLISNSTTIGNYYNSEFTLNRGKFAKYNELSDWKSYNSEEKKTLVTGSQKKSQSLDSNAILLTTGATEATNLQNIYDIAGNVWEWTLEFYNAYRPCLYSGGSCNSTGSHYPAESRFNSATSISYDDVGFRLGLWK